MGVCLLVCFDADCMMPVISHLMTCGTVVLRWQLYKCRELLLLLLGRIAVLHT